MFGPIGVWELVLIFVIALLLFGPRKLPDIGRTLGKALGEFRRASNDLKRSLEEEVAVEELRGVRNDLRDAADQNAPVAKPGEQPKEPASEQPDTAGPQPAAGEGTPRGES